MRNSKSDAPVRVCIELSQRIFCFYALLNAGGYDPELPRVHPVRKKVRAFIEKNFPGSFCSRVKNLLKKRGVAKEYWFPYRTWVLCHGQPPAFSELSPYWKNVLGESDARELEETMRIGWKEVGIARVWKDVEGTYRAVEGLCYRHARQAVNISNTYLRMSKGQAAFHTFTIIPNFLEEYHRGIGPMIGKTAYAILGPSSSLTDRYPIQRIQHELLHPIVNPLVKNVFVAMTMRELSVIRETIIQGIVLRSHVSDLHYVQKKCKLLHEQGIEGIDAILSMLEWYEQSRESFPHFLEKRGEQIKEACLL